MRIAYIAHTRFPSEKANGLQVSQVCHAMAQLGHDVTLVTPNIRNFLTADPFAYYGLPRSFTVEKLQHFDAWKASFIPGPLRQIIGLWFYGRAVKKFLSEHPVDLLYVRTPQLLSILLGTKIPVILELHTLPNRNRSNFVRNCNACKKVICLTSPMAKELASWGVSSDKIVVEPDGVNLDAFNSSVTVEDEKKRFGLPLDRPVIGYAGSLVTQDTIEKGVGELIQAAALLKKRSEAFLLWIIGGPQTWVNRYKTTAKQLGIEHDVRFEGFIEPKGVALTLRACDVLVYPAPMSAHSYFQRDTSPLKLFEYLASGIPIVCADLPPIRDVVDESFVQFCTPGDAGSIADAIQEVLKHHSKAVERAERGRAEVQRYSWIERMRRIL